MLGSGNSALLVHFTGDNHYQVRLGDGNFSPPMPLRHEIDVGGRVFDPLDARPTAPPALASALDPSDNLYIVQFAIQALPSLQDEVERLGAHVYMPLHNQAVIARMDLAMSQAVAQLPSVRWVGVYHPDYKLSPSLRSVLAANSAAAPDVFHRYNLLLFDVTRIVHEGVASFIQSIGGETGPAGEGMILQARLNQVQLHQVVELPEVMFVEPWTPGEDDMDLIREATGANYLERTPQRYTGQGVRGEVMDRGLEPSHPEYQTMPSLAIRTGNNPTADYNHGTTTFGVVFAKGTGDAKARGMLPDAEKAFFVSRYAVTGQNPSSWPANTRYDHTKQLVDPAGPYRGLFQSNSWGETLTYDYTALSADMDRIIFDLDVIILNSQSNEGKTTGQERHSRPEAWAKNIVAVGGVRGQDTAAWADDCWCGSASIGPASDGRVRPELSHFYDLTYAPSTGGAYGNHSGTSFSTPATAGHFGLLFEMWADGVFEGGPGKRRDVFGSKPHATTARAIMINLARQYDFQLSDPQNSRSFHPLHRIFQGWGFPDVKAIYDKAQANNWRFAVLVDESRVLKPLETHTYKVTAEANEPMKVTLVYADPPGNPSSQQRHAINDVNLKVTSPSNQVYWGNVGLFTGPWSQPGGQANPPLPALPATPPTIPRSTNGVVDTVENVFIQNPAAGVWTIEVIGAEIVQDSHVETGEIDADYALVVTGPKGSTVGPGGPGGSNVPGDGFPDLVGGCGCRAGGRDEAPAHGAIGTLGLVAVAILLAGRRRTRR